ncbi:hypothetical protein UFOVP124_41 [uncultured Caudovirales phage]|uniref:Right handed beta helix region n=1 Tax=uncultured Caudovirales phage TaxID=2100421 RepID=A0A6J5L8R7_9CAUD|nr:hypothetical protein UFOVP124_41 [uncultured Caudovirales phage]
MALLELYMQSGGDDRNAGTDSGSNPTAITGTTSLNTTTGVLTFTAGTTGAFTGISVGAWVSLCNSSDTAARFTGQIASNDNTAITIATTTTTPYYSVTGLGGASTLTGTVSCRVGGPWASLGIVGTNACMNSTTPSLSGAMTGSTYNGLRINVKAATYSISATVTMPFGLAAKPIWWRGYFSTLTGTPGNALSYTSDLDNLGKVSGTIVNGPSGATRPLFTCAAVNTSVNASGNNWFENIEFQSHTVTATNAPIGYNNSTTGTLRFHRCRFTARYAGVSCVTLFGNATYAHFTGCLFQGDQSISVTAGTGLSLASTLGAKVIGCTFRNCATGISGTNVSFACIYESCTTGISGSTDAINNVFRACTTGISVGASNTLIDINNIFSECGTGVAISMTNAWNANVISADYYNNSSGTTSGLWESFERGAITTETGSPFVAAGSPNYDYTLTSGSKARQAGFPGQFEV